MDADTTDSDQGRALLSTAADLDRELVHWEKTKDIVDQFIDIMLNYRQSGHPGGSRSKVHILLSLLLSGAMRWDIRRPEKTFSDRFVLGAGHTVPLIYATLATLNEAMRIRYRLSGDESFRVHRAEERALYWEDLLGFRRRGGLSGHAEAAGKTLLLRTNTGPSGHGTPAAAGQALALKRAGAGEVRVFVLEGEGGLTPGATHETLNTAYGLALDNLHFLVDWNDFGIDDHAVSTVVYGGPREWFGSHGWIVVGTEHGSSWDGVLGVYSALLARENPDRVPSAAWFRTRKGREYLTYDNASHGSPHAMNSESFWQLRRDFAEKHDVSFENMGGAPPSNSRAVADEFRANLRAVVDVMERDLALVEFLSDRLVELGESVPESIPGFKLGLRGNPLTDSRVSDVGSYPSILFKPPGEMAANRAGLAAWGAWVNSLGASDYGQPVVIGASADLAASTNIKGFAEGSGDFAGWGWYERKGGPDGALLPTEITEFSNAGIVASMTTVNFAEDPEEEFLGFHGATSTYGSFSYLKYGPLRLHSQFAQDTPFKIGKFIWMAGHSGPETADDSRTHFGIFSPGVTQLFPRGRIINLYPWEYNEVPVLLGTALGTDVPLIALHLTRPAIEVPDREKLGMPSHIEAARGAYVVRDVRSDAPRGGTFFVQGTSAMKSVVDLLSRLDTEELNVKIVCVTSPELFDLQPEEYRKTVVTPADQIDSTVITTQARWLMQRWLFNPLAEEYALSSDHDDAWRTGGSLEEVIDEARLTPEWVLKGMVRFVDERQERIRRLKEQFSGL